MTKQEFAQKLKSKYPQYQNVDNDALTDKFLDKYPIYKSRITESGLQEGGEYGITLDKPQEVIAEEKPTGLLGKTSELVSKGFEKYAEIPAVKKFSAGVGGMTGILGGAIGGILGGVAEIS